MKKCYAVYKGDKFICLGTSKECSDYLGIKISSFYFIRTKAYLSRNTGDDHLIIIEIEDDDNEEE